MDNSNACDHFTSWNCELIYRDILYFSVEISLKYEISLIDEIHKSLNGG